MLNEDEPTSLCIFPSYKGDVTTSKIDICGGWSSMLSIDKGCGLVVLRNFFRESINWRIEEGTYSRTAELL